MMDKVDMSLDDIIKQTQKPRGGGAGRKFGGRGRGGRGAPRVSGGGVGRAAGGPRPRRNSANNLRAQHNRASGDIDGRWQHDMYDGPSRRIPQYMSAGQGGSAKLIVANLDFGVSDSDVTELFSEFGSLKHAAIHYDRSGRSLGIADVIYDRRADALKALKQYNNVPLDGRPMKIKFAEDSAPADSGVGRGGRVRGAGIRDSGRIQKPSFSRSPRNSRGGRGRGGGRGPRKEVTAEELDAELDAWKKTG